MPSPSTSSTRVRRWWTMRPNSSDCVPARKTLPEIPARIPGLNPVLIPGAFRGTAAMLTARPAARRCRHAWHGPGPRPPDRGIRGRPVTADQREPDDLHPAGAGDAATSRADVPRGPSGVRSFAGKGFRLRGSSTVKLVKPGRLCTETVPSWAVTTAATMARPRPVEPAAREREESPRTKRWKISGCR